MILLSSWDNKPDRKMAIEKLQKSWKLWNIALSKERFRKGSFFEVIITW